MADAAAADDDDDDDDDELCEPITHPSRQAGRPLGNLS